MSFCAFRLFEDGVIADHLLRIMFEGGGGCSFQSCYFLMAICCIVK